LQSPGSLFGSGRSQLFSMRAVFSVPSSTWAVNLGFAGRHIRYRVKFGINLINLDYKSTLFP